MNPLLNFDFPYPEEHPDQLQFFVHASFKEVFILSAFPSSAFIHR